MNILPLDGRAALVTGAARGIGLAIAERLAQDGAKVLLSDLDAEGLARAAASIEANSGTEVVQVAGDLSDLSVASTVVSRAEQAFGTLDILVNNAGGGILRPFLEHTPDTLKQTIDRNLWTTIWCTWLSLPLMKANGFGRVINIGADSVRNGLWDHAAYNAAKGGVHGMTTGLAREFALDQITVNTVAPSVIRTPQYDEVAQQNPELVEKAVSIVPLGRPGTMEEVASVVAYLASDESGFVTGQVLSVNGGTTML